MSDECKLEYMPHRNEAFCATHKALEITCLRRLYGEWKKQAESLVRINSDNEQKFEAHVARIARQRDAIAVVAAEYRRVFNDIKSFVGHYGQDAFTKEYPDTYVGMKILEALGFPVSKAETLADAYKNFYEWASPFLERVDHHLYKTLPEWDYTDGSDGRRFKDLDGAVKSARKS